MRLLIFVLLLLTVHLSKGQRGFCGSEKPLPDKILTIQEEIELKYKLDSLEVEKEKMSSNFIKFSHRKTYGKPMDSIYFFMVKLKKMQTEIIKLSQDKFIDTSAKYKLLFIEERHSRVEWDGNTSSHYNISQFDSVINNRAFFKKEKQLFTHNYSYNNQYLISEECHEYIGNSSWVDRKVYYFEKVKK